jgi:hypothetical protein
VTLLAVIDIPSMALATLTSPARKYEPGCEIT